MADLQIDLSSRYVVFGPKFDQKTWNERRREIPLIVAFCEECAEQIMLRESASELIKTYPVICTDCKDRHRAVFAKPEIKLSTIEEIVEARRQARQN